MQVFTAVFIAIVVASFVYALNYMSRRHRRHAALLESVASDVGGRVDAGHWLAGAPAVRLRVRERAAGFELNSTEGKYKTLYTELAVQLDRVDVLALRLEPEDVLAKVGKLFGSQDVEVGEKAFDAAFAIATSSPGRLMQFLSPSVRQMLLRLHALGNGRDKLWVEVEGRRFLIRKHSWLEEEGQLREFLVTSVQVVEAYLELFGQRQLSPPDPERCPVCKDLLDERVEVCGRCGLKHHPKCFELNDGCGRCGAKAETAPAIDAEG